MYRLSAGRDRWDGRLFKPLRAATSKGSGLKGVFITTSSFTQDAFEYVRKIEKRIVLIDGEQLAELMIKHDVGVGHVPKIRDKAAGSRLRCERYGTVTNTRVPLRGTIQDSPARSAG